MPPKTEAELPPHTMAKCPGSSAFIFLDPSLYQMCPPCLMGTIPLPPFTSINHEWFVECISWYHSSSIGWTFLHAPSCTHVPIFGSPLLTATESKFQPGPQFLHSNEEDRAPGGPQLQQ